jgi:hypothetical protein
MKFTYLAAGLLTALVSAQPVVEQEDFAIDYASGQVTGEVAPQLFSEPLAERSLAKRANVEFIMYTSGGKFEPP